jgi:hypothetical protein
LRSRAWEGDDELADELLAPGCRLAADAAAAADDIVSVNPWRVRGLEIRGVARVLDSGGNEFGRGFDPKMFRVTPRRIVSRGLWGRWCATPVRFLTRTDKGRNDMTFDTPNGSRGGWQPGTGGVVGRWLTTRAMNRIRRKGKMPGLRFDALVLTTIGRKTGVERTTPSAGSQAPTAAG